MRIRLIPVLALGLTGVLVACGRPGASAGAPAIPPAPGAPYAASHACTPHPPDVIAFSQVPKTAGRTSYPIPEMIPINSFMDAHASVYGGTYFANDHGYIGFTSDAATHLAQLRALVPQPGFFVAYCAPYSIAVQRSVVDAIPHDQVLRAHGLQVLGSGLDAQTGGVTVQLQTRTGSAETLLHERYGDIIGAVNYGISEGVLN